MFIKPRKLFFGSQVHLAGGAGPADLQVMKRHGRLNHRLQEQFFIGRDRPHPALFPGVVGRMILARVVEIDAGNVLDWIQE